MLAAVSLYAFSDVSLKQLHCMTFQRNHANHDTQEKKMANEKHLTIPNDDNYHLCNFLQPVKLLLQKSFISNHEQQKYHLWVACNLFIRRHRDIIESPGVSFISQFPTFHYFSSFT